MRGEGQIAELAAIAEPDVGVIVNVGPVHLELLGTVERVAAAKAELIRDLRAGAACVVPASEPLLGAHLRDDLDTWTFGPGGQVQLLSMEGRQAEFEARGSTFRLELPYSEPHNLLNTCAAVAAARALGLARRRPRGRALLVAARRGGRAARRRDRGRTTATTPTRCRCAPPSTTWPRRPPSGGSRCSARWPSWATTRSPTTGRSARTLRAPGSTCSSRSGAPRWPTWRASTARSTRSATPEEAGALLEELGRPGDRVLVKGSRSVGSGAGAGAEMLGEIVIGGSASLLICMFLGPRFIEYLRVQEFGQHIREEGPAGHHGKAGTPTMGGLAIFLAVCVPFLILSDYRAAQPRRARHGAGHGRAGLRRRHHEAAQAALARRLGPDEAARAGGHRDRALAGGDRVRRASRTRCSLRVVDASIDLGLAYPVLIFLVLAGATNGVNLTDGLDGLAAGCAAIVFLAYTAMTFITTRPGGPGAAVRLPRRRLRRLPLVQLVPGVGVHGRHRLARPGRRDRRAGGDDEDRGAADHDRRHLRDRGALGRDPGVRLPALPQARLPDGADPPPLRAAGWSETKIILRFWIVAAICARDRLHALPGRRSRR